MNNIEKEYFKGKTVNNQVDMVEVFKNNHDLTMINYLYNTINYSKDSKIAFNSGFLSVFIPFFTIMFGLFIAFFGPILNLQNLLLMKLIDLDKAHDYKNTESIFESGTPLYSIP